MNILRVYIEFGDAVSQVSFTEEDEDDERQVSIQYVYNLSVKAKKGTLQDFSEHDEQILKQFFKDLAKPKIFSPCCKFPKKVHLLGGVCMVFFFFSNYRVFFLFV